nr:pentatricopeptide repeat-containing protein, mitochondrial [Quercus suber]
MSTTTTALRRAKWQYPPPAPTPRILHLPRRPRRRQHRNSKTVASKPTCVEARRDRIQGKLETLFDQERAFSRTGIPVVFLDYNGSNVSGGESERRRVRVEECSSESSGHCSGMMEEEKWRFQAEMLRAECNLLRMERDIAVKKLERSRVKMEKTLRSSVQTLLSYPPPAPTPRILHLPRRPRRRQHRNSKTVASKPTCVEARRDRIQGKLETLFDQERAFSRTGIPEKWRFQAEMLRAECNLLRMERDIAVKKLERSRVKMEKTLRSSVQTLLSGRKKICEGEDVSVVLEKEILDLAEKLEKLQRSLGLKDFEVRNCSNFDKQATLLQRRLEKFEVTSDEICVKEIEEMAEASLSIKTSCGVDDSFVSSGKCNVDILRRKMEGLSKGILLNRMEEEYRSMLSSANSSASSSKRIEIHNSSSSSIRQPDQDIMSHEDNKCSGRCKAVVRRIVEQVRVETEQWSQMQGMLGQVRVEMEELQASRDFWEDRALNSDHQIQSLHSAVQEWRQKAQSSESKANELQAQMSVLHGELERMRKEQNTVVTRTKSSPGITQDAQNEMEKRVLVCRLKENHLADDNAGKEVSGDRRRKVHTSSSGFMAPKRSPFRDIGNSSFRDITGNSIPGMPPKLKTSSLHSQLTVALSLMPSHRSPFEAALDQTEVEPDPVLLQALFDCFDSSPKLLHTLFVWAEKQPGFQSSATLFNSMINVLAKSKKFDSTWSLVLDQAALVSGDTFAIIIRRYARAGMTQPAIRTFEFACNLDPICESHSEMSLFEILLDSLCKEGHVKAASEYLDQKRKLEPSWVPSVRVYNILLNGWFRSRKLKHAEKLWEEMKMDDVKPSVVTYGTLVEGYCRMRYAERAIKLVHEMRKEGIEPNAIVYNPIIDALGEAQRFKEAMRMLERFLVLESGPTISTYNSLVKGFCKAGDLAGASKILKMMIGRGFVPTPTTYNYFFKYFSKHGKIEEGMNLYTKMIESGYTPDRLTYHLLMKMLCEEERLDLAVQVSKEMRARGCDMDLATSTMLVHLLCKMRSFEEAFTEFEDMIRRGIVPQYLTFQRMNDALKKEGMIEMAQKLRGMMSSVPHSMKLPNTYSRDGDASRARRTSIMRKAEAMSDLLKTCKDPRELVKCRNSSENVVSIANLLIEDIKKKADKT